MCECSSDPLIVTPHRTGEGNAGISGVDSVVKSCVFCFTGEKNHPLYYSHNLFFTTFTEGDVISSALKSAADAAEFSDEMSIFIFRQQPAGVPESFIWNENQINKNELRWG